ncbi:hypothetical protein EJ08DRAFT_696475 [Tothia fuscella]|uniref:Uncharacterized protein n=1 Tax=Tothia fuscella TaxID=1048955 RepID=A0A9P4NU91_9PEZI|nr:hypothetical protein EJ08DRAFT_696475 [Tothia fuscella]
MPPLNNEHRNHSFPPCLRFIQKKSSKYLAPPLADIDNDPWVHFLEPLNDDEEACLDYLNFTAGILTESEVSKKKSSKFRPINAKKWTRNTVSYHHGAYSRPEDQHGFVENRLNPWSHVVKHDIRSSTRSPEGEIITRPRGRSKTRTLSGHRHSWREPSAEIFTVQEEVDTKSNDDEAETSLAPPVETSQQEGLRSIRSIIGRARL